MAKLSKKTYSPKKRVRMASRAEFSRALDDSLGRANWARGRFPAGLPDAPVAGLDDINRVGNKILRLHKVKRAAPLVAAAGVGAGAYVHHKKVTKADTKPPSIKQIRRKKLQQAGYSYTTAGTGLGALGLRAASAASPKLRLATTTANKLERASTGLLAVGAGIGGASSINFANLQRAEAKREKKGLVTKSAFGVEHDIAKAWEPFDPEARRHNRQKKLAIGGYGAAAGLTVASGAPQAKKARKLYMASESQKKLALKRGGEAAERLSSGNKRLNAKTTGNLVRLASQHSTISREQLAGARTAVKNIFRKPSKPMLAAAAGTAGITAAVRHNYKRHGSSYSGYWDGPGYY